MITFGPNPKRSSPILCPVHRHGRLSISMVPPLLRCLPPLPRCQQCTPGTTRLFGRLCPATSATSRRRNPPPGSESRCSYTRDRAHMPGQGLQGAPQAPRLEASSLAPRLHKQTTERLQHGEPQAERLPSVLTEWTAPHPLLIQRLCLHSGSFTAPHTQTREVLRLGRDIRRMSEG